MPYFYVVGGAVRDAILGVKPTDIDYMVVGATPEWMLENGYTQVGADFPVFLKDGEEYALARTERKTGAGYHGFDVHADPSVTLEQDLERRDLTINSMAVKRCDWADFLDACEKHRKDCNFGDILDDFVYNYKDHIFDKVIMMNGGAFKEDPVRVFRAVRMRHTLPEGEGCRFVGDDWDYAARTWKAMKEMVESDDFKELTPERVAQEILKAASKCTAASQFMGFLGDLNELGAMPFVIDTDISPFSQPREVEYCQGLDDKHTVAFMMMCSREEPSALVKKFKARRYSNDAAAFGYAVRVLRDRFGAGTGTHEVTGENLVQALSEINKNMAGDAMEFLMMAHEISFETWGALVETRIAMREYGFEDLTEEQQKTLVGKEIGVAVRALHVELTDNILRRQRAE